MTASILKNIHREPHKKQSESGEKSSVTLLLATARQFMPFKDIKIKRNHQLVFYFVFVLEAKIQL